MKLPLHRARSFGACKSPDGRWRAAAIALIVLSGFSGRYLKVGLILYLLQVMLAAGGDGRLTHLLQVVLAAGGKVAEAFATRQVMLAAEGSFQGLLGSISTGVSSWGRVFGRLAVAGAVCVITKLSCGRHVFAQ